MKDIRLKRLWSDSPDRELMRKVNIASFPPEEYIEDDEMFAFGEMDRRVMGIYEKEAFIGFFTLIVTEACVYICYFAIAPDKRGMGAGTAALAALLELFSDRQVVVDFEAYDEIGAENREERLRRRKFYLRNGFHETGKHMFYMETEFEVACSVQPMDEAAYQVILDQIRDEVPIFPAKMYERG